MHGMLWMVQGGHLQTTLLHKDHAGSRPSREIGSASLSLRWTFNLRRAEQHAVLLMAAAGNLRWGNIVIVSVSLLHITIDSVSATESRGEHQISCLKR